MEDSTDVVPKHELRLVRVKPNTHWILAVSIRFRALVVSQEKWTAGLPCRLKVERARFLLEHSLAD